MFTAPPRSVAVPAIERELMNLWKSFGESQPPDAPAVARALVANLVAFVPTTGLADGATETLAKVMRRHPCRAIVLTVNPALTDGEAQASVALACQMVGGWQMCCEHITLTANGLDEDQLPGATLPLLVTDLPTFLWWLGDPPFGSEGFVRLAESSDRIVVDSAAFTDPLGTFTELAVEVATYGHRTAFTDLNWARLTPWRAMVASLYDSRDWRPRLDQLDTVTIEIGGSAPRSPANPAAASLILGWLASRLKWAVERRATNAEGGGLSITLRAGSRPIAGQINFTASAPPGRLASLLLKGSSASFLVTRSYDAPRAETRVTVGGGQPIVRLAQYEHRSEAELLAEEMEQLGRDRVYEEALEMAEDLRG